MIAVFCNLRLDDPNMILAGKLGFLVALCEWRTR